MRTIFNVVFIAAILIFASSCIKEKQLDEGITGKTDNAEVILRLKTPGGFSASGSRALTNAQENTITDIYVLVFDKTNTLVAIKQGEDVAYTVGNSNPLYSGSGSFSVTLEASKTTADKYNLVVLANTGAILLGTIGLDVSAISDKSYAAVTARIWAGITGAMYASGGTIPMWGESGQTVIEPSGNDKTLTLTRSVARIDVGVGRVSFDGTSEYSWDGKDAGGATIPFELTDVYVIRPNDRYSVIPNTALAAGTPTVPAGTTAFSVEDSEDDFAFTAAGGFTSRDIYVPEADILMGTTGKPGDAKHIERMAVVVGGKYNNGSKTYYRLDFAKDGDLMNVLRNHLYQFNISGVSGAGYPDVETAYKSLAMNMTVDILEWDETDMGNIKFDGQNYMSVNPTEFDLHRNAKTGLTFSVKTDYAQGWTFAGVTDSPKGGATVTWIKNVSPISGAGNDTKQTVTFDVDLNDTGVKRTAYIHIKAGDRLTFPVEVSQSTEMELALGVLNATGTDEISELVFWNSEMVSAQPAAQSFTLRWAPEAENVSIVTLPVGASAAFEFDGSSGFSDFTSSATGGSQTSSVRPTTLNITGENKFPERLSVVNFTLSSQGRSTSKSLFLRHVYYNLIPQPGTFLMDGTEQIFRVLANFQWRVEFVSATEDDQTGNSDRIKDTFATQYGGNNTTTGDPVKFTCYDYISTYAAENPQKGKITMKFSRLDPVAGWVDWGTHDITCYAAVPVGESNCYMINNADPVPILIPISQIGYAMDGKGTVTGTPSGFLGLGWISDFTKLKAQVLWSDVNKFGTDDAVVKVVTYNGGATLNDGKIVAVLGKGIGNALIILYENNDGDDGYLYKQNPGVNDDQIKWSWHIWNSTYFPYEANTYPSTNPIASASGIGEVWLDRNLGASTNTVNSITTMGFQYQWGRKDPFPGPTATSDIVNGTESWRTIYWNMVSPPSFDTKPHNENNNLNAAISNPWVRYYQTTTYDWYASSLTSRNDNLWGGGIVGTGANYATGNSPAFLHSENGKSVYDPCPEGYRIPKYSKWGTTNNEASWGTFLNLGRINNNYGGYYLFAGRRYTNSSAVDGVGIDGYYWQATGYSGSSQNAFYLGINSGGVAPSLNNYRSLGFSVRCVAE